MSEFPPKKWDVRFLQDMETLECGLQAGKDLAMEAFVTVRPARGEEGNFKFMLAGSSKLRLSFPINKGLPSPAFNNMVAKLELVPGDQIKLQKNSSPRSGGTWRTWSARRMSSLRTARGRTGETTSSLPWATTRSSCSSLPPGRASVCAGCLGQGAEASRSCSWPR